jgi:putative endopeptidase
MKMTKRKQTRNKKTIKIRKLHRQAEDDFYTFVNQPWIHNHQREKKRSNDKFTELTDKNIRLVLNKIIPKIMTTNTPDGQNVKKVFLSNLGKKTHDPSRQTFQSCLNDLDIWIQKGKNTQKGKGYLYDFLSWLWLHGIPSPLYFNIMNDPKHPKTYRMEIEQNGVFVSNYLFYKRKYDVDKYTEWLPKLFKKALLPSSYENVMASSKYAFEDLYHIEKKIASHFLKPEDLIYTDKTYHSFSLPEIEKDLHLDVHRLFSAIKEVSLETISTPHTILVQNPDFVRSLMDNLSMHWCDDSWYAYWVFQLIQVYIPYDLSLRTMVIDFKETMNIDNEISEIVSYDENMKRNALEQTIYIMNTTINKGYVEYVKTKRKRETKNNISLSKDIFEQLQKALKKRLLQNTWLEKETIKKAITKCEKMSFVACCKSSWEEDPQHLPFSEKDPLFNYFLYSRWLLFNKLKKCDHSISSHNCWIRDEEDKIYDVNAYYENTYNELILPLGILQKPFIDCEKDMVYNLAYTGTTIGHEMMHAFDDDGFTYNENGEYIHWWMKGEKEKYMEKIKDIKKVYDYFMEKEGYGYSGLSSLTIGENIADIYGLLLTEDALEEYLKERNILGIDQDPFFKKFYQYYSEQWRTSDILKKEKDTKHIFQDVHLHPKFRVNCVLSLSSRFRRIYDIKKGSGMWYPDIDMIETIW